MPFVFIIVIHLKMLIGFIDCVISEVAEEIVEIILIWPLEPFIK